MWDHWTLPCCALTARDGNGALCKLNWKRDFGLLRAAILQFRKSLLLRGFFRNKYRADGGDSGRELPMYEQARGLHGRFSALMLICTVNPDFTVRKHSKK
jgi:hypothetical protein